jgi:YihY family inner membrane protein
MGALVRRITDAFDRFQRSHRVTAVLFAVVKRYGEDRGGQLAALVTFYGFLSVFPLLLLLVTVAGLLLHGSSLEHTIVNSALSQFPVIGSRLRENIHAVSKGNIAAVVVSLLGLLYGSLGVTSSLQNATHQIWRLPRELAKGFWPRMFKGFQLLGALGFIVVLSSVGAAMSTVGQQYFGGGGLLPRILILLLALSANFAGYLLVMWLLSPDDAKIRMLIPGTIFGAIGWTVLQALSGYLIGHQFHHASQIYGFFAVVLGLVFWINLGAQLFLYSTELNLVLANRQWPRYLFSEGPDTSERSATISS